jgi:hypothetical protein
MEQWSAQQCECIVETLFNGGPVVKTANISQAFQYCSLRKSSLVKFRTVVGMKLHIECFRIIKTPESARRVRLTEH